MKVAGGINLTRTSKMDATPAATLSSSSGSDTCLHPNWRSVVWPCLKQKRANTIGLPLPIHRRHASVMRGTSGLFVTVPARARG